MTLPLSPRGSTFLTPVRVYREVLSSATVATLTRPVYLGGNKFFCEITPSGTFGDTQISHDGNMWYQEPTISTSRGQTERPARWIRGRVAAAVAGTTFRFNFTIWKNTIKPVVMSGSVTTAVGATVNGTPIHVAGHQFSVQGSTPAPTIAFDGSSDGIVWNNLGSVYNVTSDTHIKPTDTAASAAMPVRWIRARTAADAGGPRTVRFIVLVFKPTDKES